MTMTQFFDLPDGRLAYDDEGVGPLIVMTTAMLDLRSELRFIRLSRLLPQMGAQAAGRLRHTPGCTEGEPQ